MYVAWSFPAITLVIVAFNDGRWAIIYLLFLTILMQRKGYTLLCLILGFEIFIGFMGYFSEFKTVLYALVLAVLSLPGRRIASLLVFPVIIVGVVFSTYWSAIKMEYRTFLNKGSAQQVVLVSTSEKLRRLTELVSAVNSETVAVGIEATVKRISYVDLLGRAMAYVPTSTPHENGRLWRNAIQHVLVPRMINPNKESLDDSEITRRYTGMRIGGRDEGTSIGLGYMTESYVDFGRGWMSVPCLVVGIWLGVLYRFYLGRFFFQPLGASLLFVSIALNANTIAISNTKFLGAQVMMFVVYTPVLFLISKALQFGRSEEGKPAEGEIATAPWVQ